MYEDLNKMITNKDVAMKLFKKMDFKDIILDCIVSGTYNIFTGYFLVEKTNCSAFKNTSYIIIFKHRRSVISHLSREIYSELFQMQ